MTIYVFSLLVGYEISGVDYAIGNRANFFKKTKYDRKYIFSQIPTEESIKNYINIGIDIEQMMSVHLLLAGHYSMSGNSKVAQKLDELSEIYDEITTIERDGYLNIYSRGRRVANLYLKENKEYFSRINYFESERLIVTEYYSDKLMYRDYYITAKDNDFIYAKKSRTVFVDKDGLNVYECVYGEKRDQDIYAFVNGEVYNTSEIIELFIHKLNLTENDIVLIDRPGDMPYVQPLFSINHNAKIMPFLHTNHYFEKYEDDAVLYLDYEYYYWVKYSERIHSFLVSTEEQKRDLEDMLKSLQCYIPPVKDLYIGGLKELKYPENQRKRCSLISVSRLNPRKKLDWIIWATIKAHKIDQRIVLDIYGEGTDNYVDYIKNIIDENNAQSYINMKGHCDVTEVYKNYELYVSASLCETLGLSVMEALGSGNALVGLDVHYGNRLFIEPGKNGYLIDFDIKDPGFINRVDEITTEMANRIVDIFSDEERLNQFHSHSYNIAEQYLNDNIEKKWIELLEG